MGQGVNMGVVDGAVRSVGRTLNRAASVTTSTAGAVGGAAVNGVVGGIKGAAEGIQQGISKGSKSTTAAAVGLGALGAAGLIEWPVLLAVGGGALVLQRISRQQKESVAPARAKLTTVPTKPEPAPRTHKSPPQKAPTKRAVASKPAKKATGRRAGGATLRSTN